MSSEREHLTAIARACTALGLEKVELGYDAAMELLERNGAELVSDHITERTVRLGRTLRIDGVALNACDYRMATADERRAWRIAELERLTNNPKEAA